MGLLIALLDLVGAVISATSLYLYWFEFEVWLSWIESEEQPYFYLWIFWLNTFSQMLILWLFISRYV